MKIKTIETFVKPCDRFGTEETKETTFVSIGTQLPLGNNFTLEHLVTAIFETINPEDFETLYTSVTDYVIISYKTAYGKGKEYLNGFDFVSYFKGYYDAI